MTGFFTIPSRRRLGVKSHFGLICVNLIASRSTVRLLIYERGESKPHQTLRRNDTVINWLCFWLLCLTLNVGSDVTHLLCRWRVQSPLVSIHQSNQYFWCHFLLFIRSDQGLNGFLYGIPDVSLWTCELSILCESVSQINGNKIVRNNTLKRRWNIIRPSLTIFVWMTIVPFLLTWTLSPLFFLCFSVVFLKFSILKF